MKTNPNDYAHSNGQKDPNNDGFIINGGLTKREFFSAMAMQGFVSFCFSNDLDEARLAKWSVVAADALIAELNKESPQGEE